MALHEQASGKTDEWYTPPHVFKAMAMQFDMDPSHPGLDVVNWIPANDVLSSRGLEMPWSGLVWMNPPFGGRNAIAPWLERFFAHGCGVALTPDRTSAPWWQDAARQADAILFVRSKIRFIGQDGKPGKSPAQGTTLMAKGGLAVDALRNAERAGLGYLMKGVSL